MKRIIAVLASVVLLLGCLKSPEDKAKGLIKEYINKYANDPESYEPIEFGDLDTLASIGIVSPEFIELYEEYNSKDESDSFVRNEILNDMQAIQESKEYPKGWAMNHSFRAKNSFGAKIIGNKRFYFNLEIDSILYEEDLK